MVTHIAFAAGLTVSGKIFDQNKNPIPQGVVVFLDSSGKTVAAAKSDISGFYTISVPKGTYTLSVNGPKESKLEQATIKNRTITTSTTFDFTLQAPVVPAANKSSLIGKIVLGFLGIALVIFVGIAAIILIRKKKQSLPQSGSSH